MQLATSPTLGPRRACRARRKLRRRGGAHLRGSEPPTNSIHPPMDLDNPPAETCQRPPKGPDIRSLPLSSLVSPLPRSNATCPRPFCNPALRSRFPRETCGRASAAPVRETRGQRWCRARGNAHPPQRYGTALVGKPLRSRHARPPDPKRIAARCPRLALLAGPAATGPTLERRRWLVAPFG